VTVDLDGIRAEAGEWFEKHWDPDLPLREWREMLVDAGWAVPTWPEKWFGRGLPPSAERIVEEERDRVGAVGTPTGVGMSLAAPVILEYGTDDLKERHLRKILTGEHTWCQLFSEPGSGSDLAGLTTRADRDGDEWIVSGQKVWNTSAHHADYGLLLARTDWDAPKHAGITCFAIPMHQPSIEVRPLRQANGYSSFNEVFMADARVDNADMIGEINAGWAVGVTVLAHERRSFAAFGRRPPLPANARTGRAVEEAKKEADEYFAAYVWYPQRTGRVDLLVPRAQETGTANDPIVRQKVAQVLSMHRIAGWTAARAAAAQKLGRPPGPEGSISKLTASHIARGAAEAHALMTGAAGMLYGDTITEILVSVPAISIAGGTDEIQRNIIGERVLGLPKEPQVDRDLPFRDVPRNVR